MAKRGNDLTDLQAAFVLEYLKDLNATAAYKRAGYQPRTDNAASASASDLLRIPKIEKAIQEAMAKRAERTEITVDWVLRRLREEADDKSDGSSHSARIRAVELIGKHLGMFADKVVHVGGGEGDEPIKFIQVTSDKPV